MESVADERGCFIFFKWFDKRQPDVKDVIKEVQGVFDRVDSSLINLQKNTQDLQRLLVATEKLVWSLMIWLNPLII